MHIELDGYDEYAGELSPANQVKLAGLAAGIMASRLSPYPVQAVNIIGHADRALRVPAADRPKKEMDVSVDRAKTAAAHLRTAMAALPGGQEAVDAIQFMTSGVGSRERKVLNPVSDEDMRKNRRVDITTIDAQGGVIHVLPEWPRYEPEPVDPPLQKVFSIKLKEGISGGPVFQYTFLIWDLTASRAGAFDYRGVAYSYGPSSPLASESDWIDFLVAPGVTLESFSAANNAASHSVATVVALSIMVLNLPHGSIVIPGLGMGIAHQSGAGLFTLADGSIQPFDGN